MQYEQPKLQLDAEPTVVQKAPEVGRIALGSAAFTPEQMAQASEHPIDVPVKTGRDRILHDMHRALNSPRRSR